MIITIDKIEKTDFESSLENLVNALSLFDLNKNLKYYSLTRSELSEITGFSKTYIKEVLLDNPLYRLKADMVILKLRKVLFDKIKEELQMLV